LPSAPTTAPATPRHAAPAAEGRHGEPGRRRHPDRIGKALFDAGYASEDNFTAPCDAELYLAATRESRQAGGLHDGKAPPAGKPGWQQMIARLDTPEGLALYKQRKAIIEPAFAQLFARFGRTPNYRGDMVTTELHLQAAGCNMLQVLNPSPPAGPGRQHQPCPGNRNENPAPRRHPDSAAATGVMRQPPLTECRVVMKSCAL
jgi:hypothetical protein